MIANNTQVGQWRSGENSSAGFRQFYREWLPRDQQYLPVLALHGSLTQSGMWIELAERIGSVRMLCPDQRGFGASETPMGDTCAEFARDAWRSPKFCFRDVSS